MKQSSFDCDCGRKYATRQALYVHRKSSKDSFCTTQVKAGRKPKSMTTTVTKKCIKKLQKRHSRAAVKEENKRFRELSI